MAQAVIISYSAFLDANMWMGFGYSSDSATSVSLASCTNSWLSDLIGSGGSLWIWIACPFGADP